MDYSLNSEVLWVGAGNEICAIGVIVDFPTNDRMTIKWDDGTTNTYSLNNPNIVLSDDYDNSVNEADNIHTTWNDKPNKQTGDVGQTLHYDLPIRVDNILDDAKHKVIKATLNANDFSTLIDVLNHFAGMFKGWGDNPDVYNNGYTRDNEPALEESDDYQPKYRILDKGLNLYNGNYHNNIGTVFGRLQVKDSDTVGNTFDIIYTPENNLLYVFPVGTDVRTLVEEMYNIDSPESELVWFTWHGSRIQRRDIKNAINNESLELPQDMQNDIIFGLDKLLNQGDINKIIGGYQD